MFALEEGASFWDQNLTFRAFLCSSIAAFSRDFLLSGAVYHKWFSLAMIQSLNFGAFTEREHAGYSMKQLPFFVVLGVIGGLGGALFVALSKRLVAWRTQRLHRPAHLIADVLVVGAITSVIFFFTPLLFPSCQPVKDAVGSVYHTWMRHVDCPDGMANDTASLMWNRVEHAIKMLFHSKSHFSFGGLLLCIALYFFLSLLCMGMAIPSGLFIPLLMIGALYGRLMGKLLGLWLGSEIIEGTFALIGAASFLGGTVRMNLSITVMLVETTNDISWLLPILISVIVAKWTGDCFNESIFDAMIRLKDIPFLEYQPNHVLNLYQAQDVMSRRVDTLPVVVQVSKVMRALAESEQDNFPIVDFYPTRVGSVGMSINGGSSVVSSVGSGGGGGSAAFDPSSGDAAAPHRREAGSGTLLGVVLRETLVVLLSHPEVFLSADRGETATNAPPSPGLGTVSSNHGVLRGSGGGAGLGGGANGGGGGGIGGGGSNYGAPRRSRVLTLEQLFTSYPWRHETVSVSREDQGKYLSLVPYMNRSPCLVHDCASLGQCYALFRSMGIRALTVVDHR